MPGSQGSKGREKSKNLGRRHGNAMLSRGIQGLECVCVVAEVLGENPEGDPYQDQEAAGEGVLVLLAPTAGSWPMAMFGPRGTGQQ